MDPAPAKTNYKSFRKFVSLVDGRKVMLKLLNWEERQEFNRSTTSITGTDGSSRWIR